MSNNNVELFSAMTTVRQFYFDNYEQMGGLSGLIQWAQVEMAILAVLQSWES